MPAGATRRHFLKDGLTTAAATRGSSHVRLVGLGERHRVAFQVFERDSIPAHSWALTGMTESLEEERLRTCGWP